MKSGFFKKIGERVALEEAEKKQILGMVFEAGEKKPENAQKGLFIISPFFAFSGFRTVFVASLGLVFILTGGMSYAAEGALPGSPLYPVKVSFNEEIKSLIVFSEDEKADWEGRRAERRLEEAEELASKGRLDSVAKKVIEENFRKHAQKIGDIKEKLASVGNFDEAEFLEHKFETSVLAHEAVLSKLALEDGEKSEGQSDTKILAINLREEFSKNRKRQDSAGGDSEINALANLEDSPEPSSLSQMSAFGGEEGAGEDDKSLRQKTEGNYEIRLFVVEKQREKAKKEITSLEKALSKRDLFSEEIYKKAVKNLEKSKEIFDGGDEKMSSGDYRGAFEDYKKSFKKALELLVFIKAHLKLKLDISPLISSAETSDDNGATQNTFGFSGFNEDLYNLVSKEIEKTKLQLDEESAKNPSLFREVGSIIKNSEYLLERSLVLDNEGDEKGSWENLNSALQASLMAGALLDVFKNGGGEDGGGFNFRIDDNDFDESSVTNKKRR